jgi:toxin ParE1/3/4
MDVPTLLTEIRRLSVDDRRRLLVQLMLDETTSDDEGPELTEAQKQELDRRIASYEANPQSRVELGRGQSTRLGLVVSLPLIISPEAEADLLAAKTWYAAQRPGLEDDFRNEVEQAPQRIRKLPTTPRILYKGVRRVLVRRFPYGVYYRVDANQIGVLSVVHTSRDPSVWQSRA